MPNRVLCPKCHGQRTVGCFACHGRGKGSTLGITVGTCKECDGSGQFRCDVCSGSGEVELEIQKWPERESSGATNGRF